MTWDVDVVLSYIRGMEDNDNRVIFSVPVSQAGYADGFDKC